MDVLPPRLRDLAEEVGRATETSPSFTVAMAIGVTSGAIGRCDVARGGHVEPANTWPAAFLESGERKTNVIAIVKAPLDVISVTLAEEGRDARVEAQATWDAAAARAERALAALKKPDGRVRLDRDAQQRELVAARLALEALGTRPCPPDLVVQDVTPERLAQRLESNGRAGIGEIATLAEAESSLDALTGTRTNGSVSLSLKTHAGESHRDDRITRSGTSIKSGRLAMAVAYQPTVFRELLADQGLAGRGLPARFLICAPTQRAHTKSGESPAPLDETIVAAWADRVIAVGLTAARFQQSPRHPYSTPTFTFTDDAAPLIRQFEVAISRRLAPGQDLAEGILRSWASKAHGAAQRLAASLHVLQVDDAAPWEVPIPASTTAAAVALVEWFAEHAKLLFGEADPLTEAAVVVDRHLSRLDSHEIPVAEVWDALSRRRPFGSRDQPGTRRYLFDAALNVLGERGILMLVKGPSSTTGRPQGPRIKKRDS